VPGVCESSEEIAASLVVAIKEFPLFFGKLVFGAVLGGIRSWEDHIGVSRVSLCGLLVFLLVVPLRLAAQSNNSRAKARTADASSKTWSFAVSGDSRNCGDVVMPAIAQGVRKEGAAFYWHLGDFRAIYEFDEDFIERHPKTSILDYEDAAWKDFIAEQLDLFGDLPVYLALGNHEMISPKNRLEAIQQFADWLDTPELKKQRLEDDPKAHLLTSYYHWVRGGVDFITLDNSTDDQFDDAQLDWFASQIGRDSKNSAIRSVVVGMHAALPDSLSAGHSMNESARGTASGRKVYAELVDFRKQTHKNVYVLASHSHFFMENVYNTACRAKRTEDVLPGWIAGTAGAVRYRLPKDVKGATQAKTDVYGYLLGTVLNDGRIEFRFRQISEGDVSESTRKKYSARFVHRCFEANTDPYTPEGPLQPPNCPR
jgi:hypothetical protein